MTRASTHLRVLVALLFILALASVWRQQPPLAPKVANGDHGPSWLAVAEPDVDADSCVAHCMARNRRSADALPANATCAARDWWCSVNFTPDVLNDACAWICRNQFPRNCTAARFLVMKKEWDWGLGSNWHIRIVLLVAALSEARVFAYSDDDKSLWTHDGDADPDCARGKVDCYLLPITSCALPADWQSRAVRFGRRPRAEQFVYADSTYQVGRFSPKTRPQWPRPDALAATLPMSFWNAQFAAFLYRPNQRVINDVLVPRALQAFGGRGPPARFLSVFVRGGDKGYEAALRSPREYWARAVELCDRFDIRDVYVSADSRLAMDEIATQLAPARPDLRVHALNASRLDHGLTMDVLRTSWRTPAIRALLDTALADLFISQRAAVWLGTLSSNWCASPLGH